jgi:hypothetical protein
MQTAPLGPEQQVALAFALAPGQTEMAEILVEAGADVDAKCGSMRALGWAVRNRDLELARLLCERGAQVEGPLSGELQFVFSSFFVGLLSRHSKDDGFTALGLAVTAENVREDLLRLLLRFGCSPDRPFTVNGETFTPRSFARDKKKHIATAVFDEIVPFDEVKKKEEQAASAGAAAPATAPAPRKKGKKNMPEKRRPGSHWSTDDFNDLADRLLPFESGKASFSMHILYEQLPQHGRVTIQKHLQRAISQVFGADQLPERLSKNDWTQVRLFMVWFLFFGDLPLMQVIARIRQTGAEKVGRASVIGAAPPGSKKPKLVDPALRDEKAKSARVSAIPAPAPGPAQAAWHAPAAVARAAPPAKLRELSFRPLEGFVWFPGTDVLFAPPPPPPPTSASESGANVAAAPAPPVARPRPPPVVNDETRLQSVLNELRTRKG